MIVDTSPKPVGEAFRPPLTESGYEQQRKLNRLGLKEYVGAKAYPLTLATANRSDHFDERSLVEHCLEELAAAAATTHFDVLAFSLMPDHLHLLVAGNEAAADAVEFVKRFKQRTGYWFTNRNIGGLKASPTGLWQRSYHDHILRSGESLEPAAEYVLSNPVSAGLAAERSSRPFTGSLVWSHPNTGD